MPSACWFICLYLGIGSHVLIATDYVYVKIPITSDQIMHDVDRDLVLPVSYHGFKMKFFTLTFFLFEGNIIKFTGSLILG